MTELFISEFIVAVVVAVAIAVVVAVVRHVTRPPRLPSLSHQSIVDNGVEKVGNFFSTVIPRYLRWLLSQNIPRITKVLYVQVSLVIRGRYVPSFWTANPEFADKKSIFV